MTSLYAAMLKCNYRLVEQHSMLGNQHQSLQLFCPAPSTQPNPPAHTHTRTHHHRPSYFSIPLSPAAFVGGTTGDLDLGAFGRGSHLLLRDRTNAALAASVSTKPVSSGACGSSASGPSRLPGSSQMRPPQLPTASLAAVSLLSPATMQAAVVQQQALKLLVASVPAEAAVAAPDDESANTEEALRAAHLHSILDALLEIKRQRDCAAPAVDGAAADAVPSDTL